MASTSASAPTTPRHKRPVSQERLHVIEALFGEQDWTTPPTTPPVLARNVSTAPGKRPVTFFATSPLSGEPQLRTNTWSITGGVVLNDQMEHTLPEIRRPTTNYADLPIDVPEEPSRSTLDEKLDKYLEPVEHTSAWTRSQAPTWWKMPREVKKEADRFDARHGHLMERSIARLSTIRNDLTSERASREFRMSLFEVQAHKLHVPLPVRDKSNSQVGANRPEPKTPKAMKAPHAPRSPQTSPAGPRRRKQQKQKRVAPPLQPPSSGTGGASSSRSSASPPKSPVPMPNVRSGAAEVWRAPAEAADVALDNGGGGGGGSGAGDIGAVISAAEDIPARVVVVMEQVYEEDDEEDVGSSHSSDEDLSEGDEDEVDPNDAIRYRREPDDVAPCDVAKIEELVMKRAIAKRDNDFSAAFELKEELQALNVEINDQNRTWRIAGAYTREGRYYALRCRGDTDDDGAARAGEEGEGLCQSAGARQEAEGAGCYY